ncbi:MAG: hypothetical protein LUD72_10785 [Bacteroidales bacterium]|nr:hypothetical protein [Bacteroidales bacterium]
MTKEAALLDFFESFGIDAYPVSSVPEDCEFPWLTYELTTGSWEQGEIGLTVNLWYYTTSEAAPNAKAREMSEAIGYGGTLRACDGGYIWIKRGQPWCQSLQDETNKNIKRRYINISVEYLTEN